MNMFTILSGDCGDTYVKNVLDIHTNEMAEQDLVP